MSNLIILFCALIILLVAEYLISGREIFSACFIATAVFTVSTGYSLVASERFETDISIETVFIILGALLAICTGEWLVSAAMQRNNYVSVNSRYLKGAAKNTEIEPILIRKELIYLLFALTLTLGLIRYYYLYQASLAYGNPGNILKAIAYTRTAMISDEIEGHRLLSYGCTFCMATTYAAIFIYFYNLYLCKKRELKLLLPTISYLLIPLSSTGRVEYIQLLLVVFSVFVICSRKSNGWRIRGNLKILLGAILALVVFVLIFRYIGSMRDKWGTQPDVMTDLIEYLSAGIYGLDRFIKTGRDYSLTFGYETFAWLYSILNRVFDAGLPVSSFQPHFTIGNVESNIYTGIKSFIQDFSVVGMLGICFFIGFIYSIWLNILKFAANIRMCFLGVIGFAVFIYPIAMFSVAGTYNALLTTGYLMFFVFLIILNELFINPRGSAKTKSSKARREKNGKGKNSSKHLVSRATKNDSRPRNKWIT